MNFPKLLAFAPVTAAMLCLGAVPVSAGSGEHGKVEITISYADLDLSKKEDVEIMKKRIAAAAKKACTYAKPVGTSFTQVDRSCFKSATSDALAALETHRIRYVAMLDR